MAGLRQERKTRTRRDILAAAEVLFGERGYAGTTTAEIARQAGVAGGTVFNYFPAKAAILIALLYGSFQVEPYAFGHAVRRQRGWLTDEIVAFLDHYLAPASGTSKALLREVFSISFQDSPEGRSLLAALAGMDAALGQELRGYLVHLQERQVVSPQADVDGFLQVTYSVVMMGFATYTLVDDQAYAGMLDWFRSRLALLVGTVLLNESPAQPGSASSGQRGDRTAAS